MSTRFWLAGAAMTASAIAGGIGLGAYATSPQKSAISADEWAQSPEPDDMLASTIDTPLSTGVDQPGPTEIHCTGCGPTLAERRQRVELAGLDADGMIAGSNDQEVLRYLASEDSPPYVPDDPPASSPVRQLPPQVERFAMGDRARPRAVGYTVSGEQGPPPVVATVAPLQQ